MIPPDLISKIFLWLVPVITAITFHEVAHGRTALFFGDTTARDLNRLSINPIRHIDPIGSVAVPLVLLWFSSFVFGWAKPVPVVTAHLNRPKRDMIFVAAAGPASNLLMAIFWLFAFKAGFVIAQYSITWSEILIYSGATGVLINSALMMLNLLPILPLDGGRIVSGLLPESLNTWYSKTERLGIPVLIVLMFLGLLQAPIGFLIETAISLFSFIGQISAEDLSFALSVMLSSSS